MDDPAPARTGALDGPSPWSVRRTALMACTLGPFAMTFGVGLLLEGTPRHGRDLALHALVPVGLGAAHLLAARLVLRRPGGTAPGVRALAFLAGAVTAAMALMWCALLVFDPASGPGNWACAMSWLPGVFVGVATGVAPALLLGRACRLLSMPAIDGDEEVLRGAGAYLLACGGGPVLIGLLVFSRTWTTPYLAWLLLPQLVGLVGAGVLVTGSARLFKRYCWLRQVAAGRHHDWRLAGDLAAPRDLPMLGFGGPGRLPASRLLLSWLGTGDPAGPFRGRLLRIQVPRDTGWRMAGALLRPVGLMVAAVMGYLVIVGIIQASASV